MTPYVALKWILLLLSRNFSRNLKEECDDRINLSSDWSNLKFRPVSAQPVHTNMNIKVEIFDNVDVGEQVVDGTVPHTDGIIVDDNPPDEVLNDDVNVEVNNDVGMPDDVSNALPVDDDSTRSVRRVRFARPAYNAEVSPGVPSISYDEGTS